MLRILYSGGILLYLLMLLLASPFSGRARQWISGRRGLWKTLRHFGDELRPIWVHCASLGEFEQARPLIEEIRKLYPARKILLTFFSPSGYNVRKNFQGADLVCYMPSDLPWNVSRFIRLTKPDAAIFVKYEFWFNFIRGLHRNQVPVYLISGIFRPSQHFFRPYGFWGRRHLLMFRHLFVQDSASQELLLSARIRNSTICGDTRADRVLALTQGELPVSLPEFEATGPVLVAGSTYPVDEELLALLATAIPQLSIIIAPHELSPARIKSLEDRFEALGSFQRASLAQRAECRFLFLDTMGQLAYIYRLGSMAYIGGGFGKGIHNTLEAATWGLPISFGPENRKFREAQLLLESGAATEVNSSEDLIRWVSSYIDNEALRRQHGLAARMMVEGSAGASRMILEELKQVL